MTNLSRQGFAQFQPSPAQMPFAQFGGEPVNQSQMGAPSIPPFSGASTPDLQTLPGFMGGLPFSDGELDAFRGLISRRRVPFADTGF